MKRSFGISGFSGLGLTLMTTGCGEPLVGVWNLTSLTTDDGTAVLPYHDTYTYDGYTYEYGTTASLTVHENLSATFLVQNTYSYDGPDGSDSSTDNYSYDLFADKTSKRSYSLTGSFGDAPIQLACTIDGELACNGTASGETFRFIAEEAP